MKDTKSIMSFLDKWRDSLTEDEYAAMWEPSYQTWGRNAGKWNLESGLGGTYQMRAICWYQHTYKPGSTDSRYSVISKALDEAISQTTELPVDA